ncbi:hypothetical protein [Thioalkalivibrio sp.]|uniref:hypothetical protein n=1 Tax=Thioalkalivibrio sp. TaxID=2093813 RepID=UPI003976947A
MTNTPRAKCRRLIATTWPALLLGTLLGAEVSAQPPPHAPAHGWQAQEGQMPGPPAQAPAYGWRSRQGQMPAPPPPYSGQRDPRAEQRPSPWGPGVPDYRRDRERAWQHDPRREADGGRRGNRDTGRTRDPDGRDYPRYDRHQWEDEGRRGDRRLRGNERDAEDMHPWQDAEQRRMRRGDTRPQR